MQQAKARKTRKSVTSVADYIGAQLAHLPPGTTQRAVAEAIGYNKPNILVMIKRGDTKLPIGRVPALAKALGVDPAHLLRMTLNEYMPEVHDVIEKVMGLTISENEERLLKAWRLSTGETDPDITASEEFRDFEALAAKVSKLDREALVRAQDDMRKKDKIIVRELQ